MIQRPLTSADRERLAAFKCAFPGDKPWLTEVQEAIAVHLAGHLDDGARALGLVHEDDRLVAVAAYSDTGDVNIWRCSILAVAIGHRRRGLARRLKLAVMDEARAAGARLLVSTVHGENTAMIELNRLLGAEMHEERASRNSSHFTCAVPL